MDVREDGRRRNSLRELLDEMQIVKNAEHSLTLLKASQIKQKQNKKKIVKKKRMNCSLW